MKDLFNPITNPAGGYGGLITPSVSSLLTQAPTDSSKLTIGPNSSLSEMMGDQKVSDGSRGFLAGWSMREDGSFVAPRGPSQASAPATAPAPGGRGGYSPAAPAAPAAPASAPASAPAAPTTEVAMGAETVTTPQQFMNPDGSMKTPEQIATEVAETLKTSSATGDVGRMAGAEFGGANKTEEQLRAEAALVNNARNDIASGETDPFGIAGESGIAYTPAELQAIESAYAGVYDPAIVTAQAKLEAKQTENAFSREVTAEATQAERDFQNDLTMLGKKHGYDLEKMSADQEFQKSLASYKASLSGSGAGGAGAGGAGADSPDYVIQQSAVAIRSIDNIMAKIEGSTSGMFNSAKSPIRRQIFDGLAGSDAMDVATSREALEAIVGFDTLNEMRQAAKSGASGLGQVTERELKYLQSVQGSLNELQSNEQLFNTLREVRASFARIQAEAESAGRGPANAVQTSGGSRVLISPSGESFDASDLTPEEYQEAITDGFRSQ